MPRPEDIANQRSRTFVLMSFLDGLYFLNVADAAGLLSKELGDDSERSSLLGDIRL